jgi:hypothetical protein
MSTRCQIGIYETADKKTNEYDVLLYKHTDGYPEGVIPILEPIVKRFAKDRGISDTEYAAAWILYEFMEEHVKYNIEASKEYKHKPSDGKDFLSHGICGNKQLHGDIEYFYAVYPDRIEAHKVIDIPNMELVQTIPI